MGCGRCAKPRSLRFCKLRWTRSLRPWERRRPQPPVVRRQPWSGRGGYGRRRAATRGCSHESELPVQVDGRRRLRAARGTRRRTRRRGRATPSSRAGSGSMSPRRRCSSRRRARPRRSAPAAPRRSRGRPPAPSARRSRRTASRRRGAPGASPDRASRPRPGAARRTSSMPISELCGVGAADHPQVAFRQGVTPVDRFPRLRIVGMLSPA